MESHCDQSNQCRFWRRHQRDRENDIIKTKNIENDLENIILNDQLDSMHAFIFHSIQTEFVPFPDIEEKEKEKKHIDDEEKYSEDKEDDHKPEVLSYITSIIN